MRSPSPMASQFGSQEWLIQRASFPPMAALMTSPLSMLKRNVCGSSSSGTSDQGMRLPVYSMMRAPLRMRRVAKTPRPCMAESRTFTMAERRKRDVRRADVRANAPFEEPFLDVTSEYSDLEVNAVAYEERCFERTAIKRR